MINVIFTLDYEIHGNGDGCPQALMIEPTTRLLDLFDECGAKLTIMADVAEILKFKEYAEHHGVDAYHYAGIAEQLRDAVRRGHDVQLHLHASFLKARPEGGRWVQDWSEYNFAGLSLDRLNEVIGLGKTFLETLLRPVDARYRCIAFRAANWAMSPSRNAVKALIQQGIRIDTSVFKHGRRNGLVAFDYSDAFSNLLPWPVAEDDICQRDEKGKLLEFPIYSERRWIGAFLAPARFYRALVGRLHKLPQNGGGAAQPDAEASSKDKNPLRRLRWMAQRHAWKADFNQCSGRQLIAALKRGEQQVRGQGASVPFVLIGHSKLFTRRNERSLRPFLKHVAGHDARFRFAKFNDFDLERRSDGAEAGRNEACARETACESDGIAAVHHH